jgi:hypothetical protein
MTRAEDSQMLSDYRASLKVTSRLLDWFRAFIAIKLGVSSIEVIFFSVPRFHFLEVSRSDVLEKRLRQTRRGDRLCFLRE